MVNSARIFLVESLETRFVWIQKSSFQAFLQEIIGQNWPETPKEYFNVRNSKNLTFTDLYLLEPYVSSSPCLNVYL